METINLANPDNKALSIQEQAKIFLEKHIKNNNYIVSSNEFFSRKLREYLQINNYIFSPIKGFYIIKDNKTPNNLVVEQNYFELLSRLGGTLSGDIALDHYIGNIKKINNIIILTQDKNGKSNLDQTNYEINYKQSIAFRECEMVKIQGSKFVMETKLSFIINEFYNYQDDERFKFLLDNTQINFTELGELISKGINQTNLSKLAFYYKSKGNLRNYTIIKSELLKQGKSLNYGVTKRDENALNLSYLFQNNSSDFIQENIKIKRFENLFNNFSKTIDKMDLDFLNNITPERNINILLSNIDKNIIYDTYHSLTIENYKVSLEDIELLNNGDDNNKKIKEIENKLAIKSYLKAFNFIKESIKYDFNNNIKVDHKFIHTIHENLFHYFAESKKFIIPYEYRKNQVQITNTTYIPPDFTQVDEYMDKFLELINHYINVKTIKDIYKKAILIHYFFVHIHPYGDGNGRTARFLMNYIFSIHGLDWKVISSDNKEQYINALKKASENEDIKDFVKFIC